LIPNLNQKISIVQIPHKPMMLTMKLKFPNPLIMFSLKLLPKKKLADEENESARNPHMFEAFAKGKIRLLCHEACKNRNGWPADSFDFDSAYLNSVLADDEVIYLEQPPDFFSGDPKKKVFRLHKALYGLKQGVTYRVGGASERDEIKAEQLAIRKRSNVGGKDLASAS
jgi:hypothetical protein